MSRCLMLSVMLMSIIVNRDRMLGRIVLVYIITVIRSYATHRDNLHLVGRGWGAGVAWHPGRRSPVSSAVCPESLTCVCGERKGFLV